MSATGLQYNLALYCEDLREYYHSFCVSEERCHRNALALCLTRSEVRQLRCCSKGAADDLLVPCLDTLAHFAVVLASCCETL